MKTISLKLPEALAARLLAAAKQRKTTSSALLREALQTYLKNGAGLKNGARPRRLTFMEMAGDLIGSVHSGVGDLSTNPKHMEGFGQ